MACCLFGFSLDNVLTSSVSFHYKTPDSKLSKFRMSQIVSQLIMQSELCLILNYVRALKGLQITALNQSHRFIHEKVILTKFAPTFWSALGLKKVESVSCTMNKLEGMIFSCLKATFILKNNVRMGSGLNSEAFTSAPSWDYPFPISTLSARQNGSKQVKRATGGDDGSTEVPPFPTLFPWKGAGGYLGEGKKGGRDHPD